MKKMPTINTDSFYTTAQFVDLVGDVDLSPDAVKKHCQRGVIKAIKAGHSWLIHKSELDRFKKTRRGRGRPAKKTA